MFKYTLQTLDLSDNKLELMPESICLLTGLSELDLSRYVYTRTLSLPYIILQDLQEYVGSIVF